MGRTKIAPWWLSIALCGVLPGTARATDLGERQSELAATIQDAIEALPEELRVAIVLRELEGLSYEEIAGAMDCPIGTVRSRIFRARDAIDKRIRPLLEETDTGELT